jgi:hypothetical protein
MQFGKQGIISEKNDIKQTHLTCQYTHQMSMCLTPMLCCDSVRKEKTSRRRPAAACSKKKFAPIRLKNWLVKTLQSSVTRTVRLTLSTLVMAHHRDAFLHAFENADFPRPVVSALPSLSNRLQSPRAKISDTHQAHQAAGSKDDGARRREVGCKGVRQGGLHTAELEVEFEGSSRINISPEPQSSMLDIEDADHWHHHDESELQRGNIWNLSVQSRWFSLIENGYDFLPVFETSHMWTWIQLFDIMLGSDEDGGDLVCFLFKFIALILAGKKWSKVGSIVDYVPPLEPVIVLPSTSHARETSNGCIAIPHLQIYSMPKVWNRSCPLSVAEKRGCVFIDSSIPQLMRRTTEWWRWGCVFETNDMPERKCPVQDSSYFVLYSNIQKKRSHWQPRKKMKNYGEQKGINAY